MVRGVVQTWHNSTHLRFARTGIAWCMILAWHYYGVLGSLDGCIALNSVLHGAWSRHSTMLVLREDIEEGDSSVLGTS